LLWIERAILHINTGTPVYKNITFPNLDLN
jgi:hypothetical protein